MHRSTCIAAVLLVGCLAAAQAAPKLDCVISLFVNPSYGGESRAVSATLFPANGTSRFVIADFKKTFGKLTTRTDKVWDDNLASLRYSCNCTTSTGYTCSGMFGLTKLRLFSDPQRRKTRGGSILDLPCAAMAAAPGSTAPPTCGATNATMPSGWGDRVSALALTYNIADYKLPKSANGPARRLLQ